MADANFAVITSGRLDTATFLDRVVAALGILESEDATNSPTRCRTKSSRPA